MRLIDADKILDAIGREYDCLDCKKLKSDEGMSLCDVCRLLDGAPTVSTEGDLISRDATYQVLTDYYHHKTDAQHEALREAIGRVPSADRWIPVSERLPSGQVDVIVSIHDDTGDTSFDYTSFGFTTTEGEYWIVENEINYHVIAWMPLPEAYERGEEA